MEETIKPVKKRIEWIDCAKFIGIVLVVFAHILKIVDFNTAIIRGSIFSFHMPFFFIISFLTVSLSDSLQTFKNKTKKRAIHLLIPYLVFLFIDFFFLAFYDNKDLSTFHFYRYFFIDRLIGLEGIGYASAGSAWFFISLFVGQTLFDGMHLILKKKSYMLVLSIIFTFVGFLMGTNEIFLPFQLDIVLASFIFFYVGYILKDYDFTKHQFRRFLIFFAIWAVTFLITFYQDDTLFNYYELWLRKYPLFPLCYVTAISGSIAVIYLCIFICKIKYVGKALAFLGTFNIYYIIVHSIHQNHFADSTAIFPEMDYYLRNFIFVCIGMAICIASAMLVKLVKTYIKKLRERKLPELEQ